MWFNGAWRIARAGQNVFKHPPKVTGQQLSSGVWMKRYREIVSNCQVVFEWKGTIALQADHASPVKWCLKEKVLLGKWSAIAMLELQSIRFAGWALTERQHRPKAGKKKRPAKRVFFFWFPLRKWWCFITKWVNRLFPVRHIYLSIYLSSILSFIALKRTSPG